MSDSQPKLNTLPETLDVLGVKEVAPKVYEDLLQPAAQELGKSLVVEAESGRLRSSEYVFQQWNAIREKAGVDNKENSGAYMTEFGRRFISACVD